MAAPLAPTVQGPIMPSSSHVLVSGALAGATVTVLVSPGAQKVGEQVAGADGGLLVPLFASLTVGQVVFAQQTRGGQSSDPSNVGVPVIAAPDPLPVVVFASPLTECMNRILLAGLVPGAVVTVRHGGTTLGASTVTTTSAWVDVDPALLNSGMVLSAVQKVGGASSAPCNSPPLAAVSSREGLPPPKIGQPLVACDTALQVSDVVPAGETQLDVNGDLLVWTNIASSYYATGARLPRPGTFKARQVLPGCGGQSAMVDVPVGPAVTPPAPTVQVFCPETRRVLVTGLRPSGVLRISARESSGGAETEIGEIGFSTTEAQVDLPDQVGGQGPSMSIVARQIRCGLTSPPGSGTEMARPGSGALPPPTPKITEPLFACMRAVPATGLFTGVLTQAISARTGAPLGDEIVVSSPTARLPTWFPLQVGDRVLIAQKGCSAPAKSAEATVRPLPSPLPTPKIKTPVRPGATTVVVDGCLPGSRVLLLVNQVERAATEQTWTGQAVVGVGQPLVEGDRLFCVQRMCTENSNIEGPQVSVAKGRMKIDVTPPAVAGGKAVSLQVTARDADTNADLPGRPVTLGGIPVGVTGTPFGWTAPSAGASVSGTVAGGTAYVDAAFSVGLKQAIPLNLTLTPGPTVVPGQVWQTDVVWTVVPQWGGATAVTVNGNTPVAMVPPPPNPGDRVLVNLSLKAHLQGDIGGIVWAHDVIDIAGPLGFVALTKPTHAMSGLFSYGVQSVPVLDDDGNVTGYEDRLFAKVILLGVA